MNLRCPGGKNHAVLIEPSETRGIIEFKCHSRWCGATSHTVVLHRFSTQTGELVETKRFRQPER